MILKENFHFHEIDEFFYLYYREY